jgi:hypothetical protein
VSSAIPLHLVALAFVSGLLVRLLKTGKMELMLLSLGLPPIPKHALPWIAAGFGMVVGVVNAVLAGATWQGAVTEVLLATMAGGFATWGHEAVVEGPMKGQEIGVPVSEAEPRSDSSQGE